MKIFISNCTRLVVTLCLCCSLLIVAAGKPALAAEPIKIGALLSITGPAGFVGTCLKESLTLLVEDTNHKGGLLGRQIELFIEDDKSNPSNAVLAATKLIRDNKVSVIIGPGIMDSGMAIMPTVEQEGVPFVVIGPLVTPFKKWVFLLGPGDARAAFHMLEVAVLNLGAKRIALLHDSGNHGMTGAKEYIKDIKQFPGASIVIDERFDLADTNMIPQLTKIKAAKPDLVLLHTTSTPAIVIAKNYKQLGMKIPVLAAGAVFQDDFVKNAGSIAEEIKWVSILAKLMIPEKLSPSDPYRKNIYEPFKKLFKEKYPRDPNGLHGVAADGFWITAEAIKAAGSDDRGAIRDALEKIKFEGLVGTFACSPTDHQGSPRDTFPVVMIKNGEIVPFQK
jgi:branched-chain amino acid transport system substrate-binding protein